MQASSCGGRFRRCPEIKRSEPVHRNQVLTRWTRKIQEKHAVLKRRRSAYFAWKSAKNLAQKQCLLNSGLTGVTNQATKEEKLGRKQK